MAAQIAPMGQPNICPVMRTDAADAVRAALAQKGRSPFIGIACGAKTVLIRREVFKKSLAGLRIVDAELVTADEGGVIRGQFVPEGDTTPKTYRATHAIRVYAAGKGVRATRLFLHQDPRDYRNRQTLLDWKKSELTKRERPKENKYQKRIGVLERKLAKLGPLRRPINPAIVPDHETAEAYTRRVEHLWHLQRPVRRAVMALARRGKTDLTSAQLYRELEKLTKPVYEQTNRQEVLDWINTSGNPDTAPVPTYILADSPLTVTKWGEITERQRERAELGNIWDYLAKLWEFCGLQDKPGRWQYERPWGPKRYYEWQAARNERREIELEIKALREMAGA